MDNNVYTYFIADGNGTLTIDLYRHYNLEDIEGLVIWNALSNSSLWNSFEYTTVEVQFIDGTSSINLTLTEYPLNIFVGKAYDINKSTNNINNVTQQIVNIGYREELRDLQHEDENGDPVYARYVIPEIDFGQMLTTNDIRTDIQYIFNDLAPEPQPEPEPESEPEPAP
jgi:hypothetical protein